MSAFSYSLYTGDGTTRLFSVSFPYLDKAHVTVEVDGVSVPFSWLTTNTIQTTGIPAQGSAVKVKRTTPKTEAPVNFSDGSVLKESELDLVTLFNLYCAQEVDDSVNATVSQNASGVFDGKGRKTINFSDPTDPTGLVTKNYFENVYTPALTALANTATIKASEATQSAADAAAAKTSAQTAKGAAEAALADFRNRYQGSQATPPTTRLDGSALQDGDLYFRSVVPKGIYVYASGWIAAGSAVQGTVNTPASPVVATAGQTTVPVPGGYDPGYIFVFVNGAKVDAPEVNVTSGINIVFTTPLDGGEEISWVAFGTFVVANLNAGLVTYQPRGTGAVPRTVEARLQEAISLRDYNPSPTNIGPALQAAINALGSAGGIIRIPDGVTYTMTSGVTINKSVRFKGEGKLSTTIKCVGANGGVPFFNQTAGNILGFESITIQGSGASTGPIADAGSICYSAYNNSYSFDAQFIFWETISVWAGGYYHKHVNSYFEYSKTLFSGYDQNNVSFVACRWANFQTGMTVNSGEGPISFIGGSIESWADKAFTSSARQVALSLVGSYVENYPLDSCPSGITSSSGKYDRGILVYSPGPEVYPIVILGNTIYTPGVFRLVYFDSSAGSHLISKGNRFIARGVTSGPTDCIYLMSGTSPTVDAHDEIIGALPAGATYISGLPTTLDGCQVLDPVTRKFMRPTALSYTDFTLVNGFVKNTDAAFSTPGYAQERDGRIRLRGVFDGQSATSSQLTSLPAGYRPTGIKVFTVPSTWGTGSSLQLMVYPSGALILNGAYPFTHQISLDGISFYPNE